ncbi:MAG: hypothetical protein K8S15_04105 [Candidatus Aegiribacteria sp.]|nr:hypothetical protein [Candidatus Aegiribacteria sp.]
MSNSDTAENRIFDEAEKALSKEREQLHSSKKKEKKKIPTEYLLAGTVAVLVIVLIVQFMLSGKDEITGPVISQVVVQQFNGQLNALSQMVKSYESEFGTLPATEEEFLGYDDPIITYDRTASHSYTLVYTFGDSVFVLEESIETETDIESIQSPDNLPENLPTDIPIPPPNDQTLP